MCSLDMEEMYIGSYEIKYPTVYTVATGYIGADEHFRKNFSIEIFRLLKKHRYIHQEPP